MGNQTQKKVRDDEIEIQIDQDDNSDDGVDVSNITEVVTQRKNEKIKNNEMIGIQLSDLDYVPYVDLNRNTG